MAQQPTPPRPRILLTGFPERYDLPGRPAGASALVLDAHRQTQFLLATDLDLFQRAMNLQLRLVAANAKNRSPQAAALLGLWTRVFSHLADACTLLDRGSYVSCPPLLRAACECLAAQGRLLAENFSSYLDWLSSAIGQEREHVALSIQPGTLPPGDPPAGYEPVGPLYRLLTLLSQPYPGATVLQVGPDSGLRRLALSFAEGAFHLGWAELVLGWLLTLAGAQLETAIGSGILTVDEATRDQWSHLERDISSALANPRRCRAEEVDGRFLLYNFRRAASGSPRRVIL